MHSTPFENLCTCPKSEVLLSVFIPHAGDRELRLLVPAVSVELRFGNRSVWLHPIAWNDGPRTEALPAKGILQKEPR